MNATKKQTTHTPGPWTVLAFDEFIQIRTDVTPAGEVCEICVIDNNVNKRHQWKTAPPAQEHGNARLIAAAPDLFNAARKAELMLSALVKMERIPANNAALRDLLAAIAKAEGR